MTYKWWKSPHRWIYLIIAIRHFITPSRVIFIAHGCYTVYGRSHRSRIEEKVMHDLIHYNVMEKDS